jgi:hypothetical protein
MRTLIVTTPKLTMFVDLGVGTEALHDLGLLRGLSTASPAENNEDAHSNENDDGDSFPRHVIKHLYECVIVNNRSVIWTDAYGISESTKTDDDAHSYTCCGAQSTSDDNHQPAHDSSSVLYL